MACIKLKAIQDIICRNNIGGIKRIYLTDRNDLVAAEGAKRYFEYTDNRETGVKFKTGAPKDLIEMGFVRYDLIPEQSNFVTTVTASAENNTAFYKTEVTLSFNTLSDGQYEALATMLKGNFVAIVVLNGMNDAGANDAVFIGNDTGLQVSGGTINSGTALTDGVTEQIKFACNSKELPRKIDITGKEAENPKE